MDSNTLLVRIVTYYRKAIYTNVSISFFNPSNCQTCSVVFISDTISIVMFNCLECSQGTAPRKETNYLALFLLCSTVIVIYSILHHTYVI